MRKRRFGKACVALCLFAALSAGSAWFAVLSEKNAEYGALSGEGTEIATEPEERPQVDELSTAEIQQRLETDFGIGEVDLAGMEPETAREIY
ncbi:MAG: hypothetical protein J5986_03685, partial [Roseburia sp.]|nr:hypothetical protein [Roseburia sp.]